MKFNKEGLVALIAEELVMQKSTLLERPEIPIVGQEQTGDYTKDPDGYEGEVAKRSLFHMSQQAQQLHDMLQGDENLDPGIQAKITKAADYLENVFKAVVYDKQHPEGR
tara:strand:- start:48 stop:374 length:327 start_codon:yes stop_codon:yes gene_type:complete